MKESLKSHGWALMTALAAMTVLKSTQYLSGNPDLLDPIFRDKYLSHWPVVFTHAICSITVLAIGPIQFVASWRGRFSGAHRTIGRIYMLGVLGGAPTGFIMGTMAFGGPVAQAAFCLMAALWLVTAALGYAAARQGRIAEHRHWMIRNYALAFGAVTLRLQLSLLGYIGLDFATIYPYVAWTAWIPNLIAAEWIIGLGVQRGWTMRRVS